MILDPILWWFLFKRYLAKKKAREYHQKIIAHVEMLEGEAKNKGEKKVLFYPEMPNQKAGLYLTFKSLGYTIHNDPKNDSDVKIAWEDKTYRKKQAESQDILKGAWNAACLDISKTYVDQVHQKVFGYSTRLDPTTYRGLLLEKSELNGHHEARILEGPVKDIREGYIYQKLINNQVSRYLFEDIRPMYIKGEIPYCYLNYRLKGKRFSSKRYKAELAEPTDVLSNEEIEQIRQMCTEMQVDYAEIDCMRDQDDGKLYVVDVNTTAFIYGSGQSLEDKFRVISIYREKVVKYLD